GSIDEDTTNNATADNDAFIPNSAPVAVNDSYVIAEDGTLAVGAAAGVLHNDTDVDLNLLTASLVTSVAHGTLSFNADGSFVYTPVANYFGSDSFTYRASDGTAQSAVATVALMVTAVNDAPTLDQPANLAVQWTAGPQTVTLSGISAGPGETDPLSVTVVSGAPGSVVASAVTYGGGSTATFTLAPVSPQQGVVPVTVSVGDGTATTVRTFTMTVNAPPFYLTRIYPATGPSAGGTHIRLFGAGFTLPAPAVGASARVAAAVAPTVLINGIPAPTVVVESDGVVSAVTPALPAGQPLDVQLILPGGTGQLVRAYTPFERPAPNEPTEPTQPGDPSQPTTPADPTNPMDRTAPTLDSDGDGIPDVWETFYGLDPFDPADAGSDPDGDGTSNLNEFVQNTHPEGRQARFFAEGNAQTPFRTWVNFYNPTPIEAAINVTFYLDDASVVKHLVKSPAGARLTVDSATIPGLQGHAFGMRIEADEAVVINRTITWNDQGVGATAERAVELSPTWYFAEGATHQDLQTFLLFANPSDADIVAQVEYLVSAAGQSVVRSHVVPAHSRVTVWVNQEGPEFENQGFGTVVRASAPLVAERATYIVHGSSFDAGETSVGTPQPSKDWYFAEGSSGPFFDAFLLLANPSDQTAEVQVRYLADHGETVVRTHTVGPKSRVTVPLNEEASWDGWTGLGMHVTSTNDVAIVAERAMWWSTDEDATWEEGHGSAGLTAPATSFAVGDGIAGGAQGASTYLLMANPGNTDALVRVTLGFEDGTAPVAQDIVVAAGRRLTMDVAASFPDANGRRFSARVDSSNQVPIVVEQSIYWSLGSDQWKTGVSLPATRLQ
ncbi:MAG TPA: cadherin-like domain-containing protein, partial [Luteitalea sp.]|nr:cadherin-like domain-containing protein [Luteitalea sp.]